MATQHHPPQPNPNRPTLAVALIVKNEAIDLERCLDSVRDLADEIVIVDSGSTDETETIARRYTDKFYVHADWPGFGPQRQRAQQYVTSDWILWLDADEVVTPTLAESIRQAVSQQREDTIYYINRAPLVFGVAVKHSGLTPDYVARLYPTKLTQYNDALVHERVLEPPHSSRQRLNGDLLHYTYRSLEEYLTKSLQYAEAWASDRAQQGQNSSLSKAVLKGIGRFFITYFIKRGFLDGKTGFLIAIVSAQYNFNKYALLHYKQQQQKRQ